MRESGNVLRTITRFSGSGKDLLCGEAAPSRNYGVIRAFESLPERYVNYVADVLLVAYSFGCGFGECHNTTHVLQSSELIVMAKESIMLQIVGVLL